MTFRKQGERDRGRAVRNGGVAERDRREKCLRGEHEAVLPPLMTRIQQTNDHSNWIDIGKAAVCRHCRSLFVEKEKA